MMYLLNFNCVFLFLFLAMKSRESKRVNCKRNTLSQQWMFDCTNTNLLIFTM